MKELITAATIRAIAHAGKSVLEYSKRNSIITPEAKDLAHSLGIQLQATDYVVTQKIYRKFCGIRPNFSISDRDLLLYRVKDALLKTYPDANIDDDALNTIIDNVLTDYK